MVNRLNDLTGLELDRLYNETTQLQEIRCELCAKPFRPNRKWQNFCSPVCRNKWHDDEAARVLNRLVVRIRVLEQDNAELLREISELRRQLGLLS